MRAKDFIPASKPRNPVVRQQQTSGAGAHRDKKKEQKQGYEKHKGKGVVEGVEDFESRRRGKSPADLGGADAWYHRGANPAYYGYEKGSPEAQEYLKAFDEWDEGPSGGKQWESVNMQERDRSDDWDEGDTEPPNNFAVYINGKKWKVFQGRGFHADDFREKQHYQQLKDWARKKSTDTGKKWEVYITGEAPTA